MPYLYAFAYLGWVYHDYQLIFELENPNDFKPRPKGVDNETLLKWRQDNTFCYELIIPDAKDDSVRLFHAMQRDLNNYFGLEASIQKRSLKCYLLIGNGSELLKSKGDSSHGKIGSYFISYKNRNLDQLVERLQAYGTTRKAPFLNESSFKGKIDIELTTDPMDIQELNRGLKRYGLEIAEDFREFDVLVFSGKRHL